MQANQVFHADALALLRSLSSETVDLIYTEPPRDQGFFWDGAGPGDHSVLDSHTRFIQQHFIEMKRVLKPNGTLCVHLGGRWLNETRLVINDVFGSSARKSEVTWQLDDDRQDVIVVYGNVLDKTTMTNLPTNKQFLRSLPGSTISHYPGSLPIDIVDQFVRSYAFPDALLLDPFAGSGTSGEAALNNGCRFILGDCSPWAQEVMFDRFIGKDVEYAKL